MADYKELLRRAVEALPENNGAARRAVYEKARAALVGQLRAINPPLAARDITAHRLQLEDCIRQVEQEASEAVIAGMGGTKDDTPPPPVYFEPPGRKAPPAHVPAAPPPAKPHRAPPKEAPRPLPAGGSIEEIIAAANAEPIEPQLDQRSRNVARPETKPMGKPVPKLVPSSRPQVAAVQQPEPEPEYEEPEPAPVLPARPAAKQPVGRPVPSIVAKAEAVRGRNGSAALGAPIEKPFDGGRRSPMLEPRREATAPRFEPAPRPVHQPAARNGAEPIALFGQPHVPAAMSAVREVEVEAPVDPQGAIDRAIATLDREARGDTQEADEYEVADYEAENAPEDDIEDEVEIEVEPEPEPAKPARKNGLAPAFPARRAEAPAKARVFRDGVPARGKPAEPVKIAKAKPEKPKAEKAKPEKRAKTRPDDEAAAGFPKARAEDERGGVSAVTIFLIVFAMLLAGAGGALFWAVQQEYIDLNQMFGRGAPSVTQEAAAPQPGTTSDQGPATGPGNTDAVAEVEPAAELAQDERLGAEAATTEALPLVDPATEARLAPAETTAEAAEAAAAAIDPTNIAGSQSLLLEASDGGTTGAVPYSGTVEWSKGTDERGLPTLIGKASIPARNLGVDVLIRKNSDPSLPASHLMEVNFRVSDTFIGGSVAGLPGVLLKNEELVQGTPLVGASARVVGNSFLFALSAAPEDISANNALLTGRKWMDLALIYATGKRAIITLEKDEAADTMFKDVFAAWAQTAATN